MLKSVIFLSISTILVYFFVYGNASNYELKKKSNNNNNKKGPMSLKTNEHRGFYPGSERYQEAVQKRIYKSIKKKERNRERERDYDKINSVYRT